MAYTINLSNGNTLTVVEDGQVDSTTTTISLVGKNFSGYGEYINENFVRMLEHFANDSSPSSPLPGQLWFHTASKELRVYNGASWVATSKPAILNDTVTSRPHYITFVEDTTGFPNLKASATKGIVYTPSTGNFGLGVLEASSKLVINANPSTTVQLSSPNTNTTVHVHSNNGAGQTVLLDSYGGTTSAGNYNINNSSTVALRRSNGTSSNVEGLRNNDLIGVVGAQGHNSANYTTNRAAIVFQATENWSQGSNGTRVVIQTTQNGTSNTVNALTINGDRSVDCAGNVTVTNNITAGGTIRADGDVVAYYTSDKNLKTNIEKIENALEKTTRLNGVTFNWNELAVDKDPAVREPGVLAQDLLEVLPEAVTERADGYLAVRYEKMVPLLIEAIKELKNEIDQLKKLT